jgi:N-acetylneuraminate synthase/N,N'-diacetyllegionaminate synthase
VTALHIGQHIIGEGDRCFVIAEAGVNHNGDIGLAHRLLDAAADAGADAIKFQTFKADKVVTAEAPKADYQKAATSAEESQLAMLQLLELSPTAHTELQAHAAERGLVFLSTPFDDGSADLLATLHVPALKIPSGEITNLPFLEYLAQKGLPILLSTGMSTLEEVRTAVTTLRTHGNTALALLHCVSNYPAAPEDANLRAMQTMRDAFDVPVGFSDHSLGIEIALAAAALGACVLEKHLTLDRTLPGPDHTASLEPADFAAMVSGVRNIERALGHGRKEPAASEANTSAVARRSLIAARAIASGEVLGPDSIVIKRPGTGLAPALRAEVLGRKARVNIPAGTLLTWEMLA